MPVKLKSNCINNDARNLIDMDKSTFEKIPQIKAFLKKK